MDFFFSLPLFGLFPMFSDAVATAIHCYLFICLNYIEYFAFVKKRINENLLQLIAIVLRPLGSHEIHQNCGLTTASNPFCVFVFDMHLLCLHIAGYRISNFLVFLLSFDLLCNFGKWFVHIFVSVCCSNWSLPQFIACLFICCCFCNFSNLIFFHWKRHRCVLSITFDCNWISISSKS